MMKKKNEDRINKVVNLFQGIPFGLKVIHIKSGLIGNVNFITIFPKYDGNEIYDYDCSIDFCGDGNYIDIDEFEIYDFAYE